MDMGFKENIQEMVPVGSFPMRVEFNSTVSKFGLLSRVHRQVGRLKIQAR